MAPLGGRPLRPPPPTTARGLTPRFQTLVRAASTHGPHLHRTRAPATRRSAGAVPSSTQAAIRMPWARRRRGARHVASAHGPVTESAAMNTCVKIKRIAAAGGDHRPVPDCSPVYARVPHGGARRRPVRSSPYRSDAFADAPRCAERHIALPSIARNRAGAAPSRPRTAPGFGDRASPSPIRACGPPRALAPSDGIELAECPPRSAAAGSDGAPDTDDTRCNRTSRPSARPCRAPSSA